MTEGTRPGSSPDAGRTHSNIVNLVNLMTEGEAHFMERMLCREIRLMDQIDTDGTRFRARLRFDHEFTCPTMLPTCDDVPLSFWRRMKMWLRGILTTRRN